MTANQKNMKCKYLILSCVFLLLFSCRNFKIKVDELTQKNSTTIYVNIDEIQETFPWNEFIDSIAFFPLETSKQSIFSQANKLINNSNKFYIFDLRLQNIFIFNENGTFYKKIDQRGNGPGQYKEIKDFHFDNENNLVVLDYKKIHIYNHSLKYLHSIDNEDSGEVISLCYFDDSHYYTFNMPIYNQKKNYLISQRKGYKKIQLLENNLDVISRERFIRHDEYFYMIPPYFQNQVYCVTKDSIFIKFTIDFNGSFIPIDDKHNMYSGSEKKINEMKMQGYVYGISQFYELSNYIYFNFVIRDIVYSVIVNKLNNKVVIGKKNLLFNEIPISIKGYSEIENCIYAIFEPYTFLNKKVSNKLLLEHSELLLLNELKETQNPFLFKLYLN
jgi:hypothetical protein